MKAVRQILDRAASQRAQPWALATLVRTRGSTYRKPGARMLVEADGATVGVLSGGCLEEEIARHGRRIIASGEPALLAFDTRRLYGCDGQLEIFVERVPPAGERGNLLTALGEKLARREPCRVRTCYAGGPLGSELLPPEALLEEAPGALIHTIPPPVRLLLFGNGPEVEPILQLAATLGWVVEHFAHPSALATGFLRDEQTAALVMTHHFGRDLAALDRLLPLQLPYLGLLGPRKRQGELIARLHEHHPFDPALLSVLHAPAGLDIGSEAPEEIALSIVSEVAAVLAARSGGFLRDRAKWVDTIPAIRAEDAA